ncbi:MAG: hypothetical protein DVB22_002364 [Verrucomicrobia bacterium]|nr:MAG: hypothetical protein DVB22_002364 [Verrucomicrobiota bacterium]
MDRKVAWFGCLKFGADASKELTCVLDGAKQVEAIPMALRQTARWSE